MTWLKKWAWLLELVVGVPGAVSSTLMLLREQGNIAVYVAIDILAFLLLFSLCVSVIRAYRTPALVGSVRTPRFPRLRRLAMVGLVVIPLAATAVTAAVVRARRNITIASGEQTLTDGTHISWDLSLGKFATVTLDGNRILDNPTNLRAGADCQLVVRQDETGTRLLRYGTAYKFPGGVTPTLSASAGVADILRFTCDGTNMLCVGASFSLKE